MDTLNIAPEGLAALLGLFMPFVVELIKIKLPTKRWVAYTTSWSVCTIVGIVSVLVKREGLEADNVLGSVGAAFLTAQTVYSYYFKPKRLDEKIQKFVRSKFT